MTISKLRKNNNIEPIANPSNITAHHSQPHTGKAPLNEYGSKSDRYSIPSFNEATRKLSAAASGFYFRGWILGTSGNLSAVTGLKPTRITITKSEVDKGHLDESGFLEITSSGEVIRGSGCPSAETPIHVSIIEETGCRSVMHTHSVPATILSLEHLRDGQLIITGLEMLKGLDNVKTHEHIEVIPIIENSQDMKVISRSVREVLRKNRNAHAFLLSGHGLYTWGSSIYDAARHVEVLEFILEVILKLRPDYSKAERVKMEQIVEG
ncbi:MAG: methylthioribulose 1-phosphate dehydratase [Thermoplasmatales archaeon]